MRILLIFILKLFQKPRTNIASLQSQFSNYSIPYMYALLPVLSACTANNHKYSVPVVTYVQVTGLAYSLRRLVATVDYGS